jgi:tyrosinase
MAYNAVATAVVASLCLVPGVSAWPFSKRQTLTLADVQKQATANAYAVLEGTLSDGMTRTTCTKENVAVRKEL